MRVMLHILLVAALVGAFALLGCTKSGGEGGAEGTGPAPAGGPAKAGEQTPPPADAGQPAEPAGTPEGKPADVQATAPQPTEPAAGTIEAGAKTAVNKETLAKAYEEIYCAQKEGRTDQILDIYKKYGFDSPKQWTEAWAATSEDVEWQAALTRRVQTAECK